MIFLIHLEVTWTLCGFRLVVEGKPGKEIKLLSEHFMRLTVGCIPLSKNHKRNVLSEKVKTHLVRDTQLFFCIFEAIQCPFSKFSALFIHSYITIICYFILLVYTTLFEKVSCTCLKFFSANPLNSSVAFIQKPVNWFAVQINWLVSVWG